MCVRILWKQILQMRTRYRLAIVYNLQVCVFEVDLEFSCSNIQSSYMTYREKHRLDSLCLL